jgi:hypothetical protein
MATVIINGKSITDAIAADISVRSANYNARFNGRNSVNTMEIDTWPDTAKLTNEERSQLEVWQFVNVPPDRYFVYVSGSGSGTMVTTWTGDSLMATGGIMRRGYEYRSNFGDKRVPISFLGRNGLRYYGTWYVGAGDYARVKTTKRKPVAMCLSGCGRIASDNTPWCGTHMPIGTIV